MDNVSLYNLVGQKVLTVDNVSGFTHLDISNLPMGTYILKVLDKEETGIYKLLKKIK